ncbi:AFG1-like ATPase [Chloropicon primus]|nr:AFG1-like ATPase [Chloropicon primus]
MSVLKSYLNLVGKSFRQGGLRRDVALAEYETARVEYLQELERQAERIAEMKLEQRRKESSAFPGFHSVPPSDSSDERSLRKMRKEAREEAENLVGSPPEKPRAPQSVYIHGHVGTGKTFLMDLFYQSAQQVLRQGEKGSVGTSRLHFNSAMLSLHAHMHGIEKGYFQRDKFKQKDPGKLAVIAARRRNLALRGGHKFGACASAPFTISTTLELASREIFKLNSDRDGHLGLVCFDELQVPDGFTAIAIMSIFRLLFEEESVVVTTTNCAPHELNDNAWFNDHWNTNFTQMLFERCAVLELNNGIDYRTIALGDRLKSDNARFNRYFYPQNKWSDSLLTEYIEKNKSLYGREDVLDGMNSTKVDVMFGRTLSIPTVNSNIAKIDFLDFFSSPVGPSDCLAIARNFKMVCIENIPVLSRQKRDQARRFITMIDELYNEGCLLVCTAEASPDKLFKSEELGESLLDLEAMQFEAEALAPHTARSRVDSSEVGGVAPEAMSQKIGSGGDTAKFYAGKMTGEEEQFAFKRAVSRILEMQGEVYMRRHRKMHVHPHDQMEEETNFAY